MCVSWVDQIQDEIAGHTINPMALCKIRFIRESIMRHMEATNTTSFDMDDALTLLQTYENQCNREMEQGRERDFDDRRKLRWKNESI
jgi:hypothetical protein